MNTINMIIESQFFFPSLTTLGHIAVFYYVRYHAINHLGNFLNEQHWLVVAAERALLPLQTLVLYSLLVLWLATLNLAQEAINTYHSALLRLLFIWWLWRSIGPLESRWVKLATGDTLQKGIRLDKTSASAITKLFKGILVAILFLTAIDQLGFDVSSLLAIGGIGGIIIGLAAQEVLSNFLSSVILYLERPFKVGDFIMSPDREIMGTVREIGWRRTSLTTLNKRDILVPNHVFNSIAIENFDTITHRRVDHAVGLRYQDTAVVQVVVHDIQAMLNAHPDLAHAQEHLVSFDGFGASSLDIKLIFYTKTTDFNQHHLVKQDIFLQIIDIVHQHGADFAFPSRTLYIEQNDT